MPAVPRDTASRDAKLREIFTSEWAPMVRLATLLLGDQAAAEEVVQDALMGLHRSWWRLADSDRAGGYLRRSVVNGCRSVHRRREVERRLAPVDVLIGEGPAEHVERADEAARLLVALRRLSDRQRAVLVMRYYADASETEIAAALRISKGSVKSHAHRGLAALRAALEEVDHD